MAFLKKWLKKSKKVMPGAKPFEKDASSTKLTWDDIVEQCYDKQLSFVYTVAKIVYTDDRTKRAVILQKPDLLYSTVFQTLYPYDEDELSYTNSDLHGYWSEYGGLTSIFDTVKRAEDYIRSEPPFRYNKHL